MKSGGGCLPSTMKAVVNYGAGRLALEEVALPQPREGLLLVRILACGICGGDYKMAAAAPEREPAAPAPGRGQGSVPGHEAVGEVVSGGCPALPPGTVVAIAPNTACGLCVRCRRGVPHLCAQRPVRVGGYAEYSLVRPEQCFPVPGHVPAAEAALTEPLACCLYALGRADVRPGDRVLIVGAGANAQLFGQLARLRGASHVAVADDRPDRLALALALGADRAFDPAAEDPRRTAELADGADVVIVNRGGPRWTAEAVRWCGAGGRVLLYGVAPAGVAAAVEPHALWQREIALIGSRSYAGTFGSALALIATGRVRVRPVITRTVPLEGAIEALRRPLDEIKTVIVPQAGEEAERSV